MLPSRSALFATVSRLPPLAGWTIVLAVSALLGLGLDRAGMPAALLLGPMIAGIGLGVGGASLSVPRPAFHAAQAVIGCLVAQSVTPGFARTLFANGPVMLAVVLVTVAAGALVGLVLTRLRVLPGTAAAWGSSPGGAAAMVAMSEAYGCDPRLVAFMQYVRVAAVVLSAALVTRLLAATGGPPPRPDADGLATLLATLAIAATGAGAAIALRVPAGAMIGPMLLGAVLQATGTVRLDVPGPVIDLGYALVGWYVGLRFTRETLRAMAHALPGVLIATASVILLCGVWAWGLTRLLAIDFLTAFLATSPGGLDSVAIIAVDAGTDVSFVLGVQTLRLLVVLITGPLLAKWISRNDPGP